MWITMPPPPIVSLAPPLDERALVRMGYVFKAPSWKPVRETGERLPSTIERRPRQRWVIGLSDSFIRFLVHSEGHDCVSSGSGWTFHTLRLEGHVSLGAAGYFGPPTEGQLEIGYSLREVHQGQGYATEGVLVLVTRAFHECVLRVIAHAADENLPSRRVLECCGFTLEGPGEEARTVRYHRDRS